MQTDFEKCFEKYWKVMLPGPDEVSLGVIILILHVSVAVWWASNMFVAGEPSAQRAFEASSEVSRRISGFSSLRRIPLEPS